MSDVPLLPEQYGPPRPVDPDLVFTFRPLADTRPLAVRIRNLLKFALRCERFRLLDIQEKPEKE